LNETKESCNIHTQNSSLSPKNLNDSLYKNNLFKNFRLDFNDLFESLKASHIISNKQLNFCKDIKICIENYIKDFNQYLNELRVKYQMNNKMEKKKAKNEVDNVKKKMSEKQKEINTKENNDKILIEKYKKLLQDANQQISDLNNLINKIQGENLKNFNNNEINNSNGNKVEKNRNIKYITNDYSLTFPEKYHGKTYNLEKIEKTKDGITINYYNNNKKEMIYKNGMRKEIYGDEYQIIYFNNGDIKQIFPKENKQIY